MRSSSVTTKPALTRRALRGLVAYVLCLLAGCTSSEPSAPANAGSASGAGGGVVSGNQGGTSAAGAGAGANTGGKPVAGGPSMDAAIGGAGADSVAGGAATAQPDSGAVASDGGTSGAAQTVPAVPVAACDDALDAQPGVIVPDVGDAGAGGSAPTFDGDPAGDGRYEVLELTATIANPDPARVALPATFYLPVLPEGATERLPLVLVMHGFGLAHPSYAHFSRHFASHGLIALGITLPPALVAAHDKNAAEARAAIDHALSDQAPVEVRAHVDPQRIAAAGHSFGGKIAFYAAALDPRIDLVIGWDPSNAGGPPCFIDAAACNDFPVAPNCLAMESGLVHELQAASLVFRAAPDGANPEPAHNAIHFHRGAPAPATLIDFAAAVLHGDFANPDAAAIPHTRRVQLAFLLSRFFAVRGLDPWLPGGAAIAADPLVARVQSR